MSDICGECGNSSGNRIIAFFAGLSSDPKCEVAQSLWFPRLETGDARCRGSTVMTDSTVRTVMLQGGATMVSGMDWLKRLSKPRWAAVTVVIAVL